MRYNSIKLSIYALSSIYSDEKSRSEKVIAKLFARYHPSLDERREIVENVYGTLKMQGRIDYILNQLSIEPAKDTMDTNYKNTEYANTSDTNNKIAILRLTVFLKLFGKMSKNIGDVNKYISDINKYIRDVNVNRVKNKNLENEIKRIISESERVEYPDRITNRLEYISTYYSHPYWFVKRVDRCLVNLGIDDTARFCEANNLEPPLVIRANTLKTNREELAKQLKEEGFDTFPTRYSPFGLVVKDKGDIYNTKSFSNGLFEVQDEASQLVTILAKPPKNGKVVDACAGSGGKTIFISALMENKGRIIGVELYKNKIITLKKRARRAGAFNIEPMETTDPDLAKIKGDVVLIDTPCTGTGTFRRNPESRWRVKETDVEELRTKQKDILRVYSKNVKTGGRLVYSTCSVLREENEDIIEDFVKDGESGFKILNVQEFLPKECNSFVRNGYFRSFPHVHNTDGFFAAVLERVR